LDARRCRARMPAGIDSCRYAVVRLKMSILNGGDIVACEGGVMLNKTPVNVLVSRLHDNLATGNSGGI
jgi:hypothetical protein